VAARTKPSNRLTPQFYSDLIAAYRENPGRYGPAARAVGCDPATAKRGWEQGWLEHEPWARPIRDIIAQEVRAARVKLEEERQAKVDKIVGDAAKSTSQDILEAAVVRERALAERAKNLAQLQADAAGSIAEEAKMIRAYRTDLHGVAAMANQLLSGMEPIVKKVREALQTDTSMKPAEAIAILRQLTSVLKEGAEAAQKTMEMERLLLGQPQQILEERVEPSGDPADSLAKLSAAFETLQRLGMTPPSVIDVMPKSVVVDVTYSEESEASEPPQLPPLQADSNDDQSAA
jgi:hypothetical protein